MTRWNRNTGWCVMAVTAILLTLTLAAAATASPVGTEPSERPAWAVDRDPVSIVTNGWVDVRDILRNLSENAGLGLQMAPDVEGRVNVHLEGVTLDRALDALLLPAELGYEVVDGVLVVYKQGMVTRWFTFDYPVTEREGRGELEVSAGGSASSSGSGSSGSSEGGESGSNKSHVTSTATMSVWPEVMESLKIMVFQGLTDIQESEGGEKALAVNLSDRAGRTLVVNPMASLVMVHAEWSRVRQVEQLLDRLKESLQRQVAIEVRILEVYLNDESQTGIDWNVIFSEGSEVGMGLTSLGGENIGDDFFQFSLDSKHVKGVLQAISTRGDLRNVSNPKITTLNNQKAVVRVVTEDVFYLSTVEPAIVSNGVASEAVINYTPQPFSTGVVLDVTPQVGQDRVITLNVHPTISNLIGVAESPNEDTAPILSVRELDTVGKVRDGNTLVIAGLMSELTTQTRTGVPFLKDLPVLGYLFGKTSDSKTNIELVMLLTPVIMDDESAEEMARAAEARVMDKF